TVDRPPPPLAGMQPSQGWKAATRPFTSSARKYALRVVVTPGETGEPSRPSKARRTSVVVAAASTPPTTPRFPHESRKSDSAALRTTTHGPPIGMQAVSPRHSSTAPLGAAVAAIAARA